MAAMLLLIPLICLSLAVRGQANPIPVQEPQTIPLRWLTQFGTHFEAGSQLELSWIGGEGSCEVYYVPMWPGQREYDLLTIEANATESILWDVPTFNDYPKGTTFIMGIKGTHQPRGADWYDLSPSLPLLSSDEVDDLEEPEQIVVAPVEDPEAATEAEVAVQAESLE